MPEELSARFEVRDEIEVSLGLKAEF